VKFERCNAQTLPASFDWSTPIFFHFLGILFVKFESGHPSFMKNTTGVDGTQFRFGGIYRKSGLVG
jgi:hypothetical protein